MLISAKHNHRKGLKSGGPDYEEIRRSLHNLGYKKTRGEMRELLTARENVRRYLELDAQPGKQNDHDRKNLKS